MITREDGEMIGYKLVTQEYRTREGYDNETKWEIGVKVEAKPGSMELCTDTVVHFYDDPLLAVLMNPIHAEIENPRMLEVEIHGEVVTNGTKCGAKSLTPIREIEVPEITMTQRIAFGLLCAKESRKDEGFSTMVDQWLSGKDRTQFVCTTFLSYTIPPFHAINAIKAETKINLSELAKQAMEIS